MAYNGLLEDIQACIKLEKPNRLPVFPMSQIFDVGMCDVSYEAYATDARLVARCHIDATRRFDYDWTILHIDAAIEPEVLGVGFGPQCGGQGTMPWVPMGHLPPTEQTLAGFRMPDPYQDGRMPLLLEAISTVRAELGDTVCVMGRLTGPFTLMTYLYGTAEGLVSLYAAPELIKKTMEFLLELQMQFGKAQLEAGAHAIYLCDLNSASRLISPDHYIEFVFDVNKRLVDWLHEHGGLVFHHPNDPDPERLLLMAGIGSDVITVGDGADIVPVKQRMGDRICLMGNVDPIPFFKEASPAGMKREVKRIMDGVSRQGGHILSSGAAIPLETPPENVVAFVEAARSYWN